MSNRIPLKTKLGFGAGDIFGGGAMTLIGVYYLFFLTDVLRINPALAGVVILVSKIWDAVSDPLMGAITDRTRSRFGRRRPYFLIGIPFIFVAVFLLWFPVSFQTQAGRFAYALSTYLLFSTVYTVVLIPYYALTPELSPEYTERSSLMSVRMVFSGASAIACGILPLAITKSAESIYSGYTRMGMIFGLGFALPFLAVFFTTRERNEFMSTESRFNLRHSFLEPLRNRSFRNVLVMYLFTFVAMDIVLSVVIYFMTYYLRLEGDMNFILGALMVAQVGGIPAYFAIGKRWGKSAAYTLSGIVWTLAMLSSLLLKPGAGKPAIMMFGAFVGLGTSGAVLMVWSIFADVPDIDELYSGERREGLYSGIFTFTRKVSSAVGLFLVSNLLNAAGYRNPEAAAVSSEQSAEFLLTLRLVFALVPAVFIVIALVGAKRFPLTQALHRELKAYLEGRRKGTAADGSETERRLKNLLLGSWSVPEDSTS